VWSRGDGDFDLGVLASKLGETFLNEGVHALGTPSPVAVVKVKAFALQDEGANTILQKRQRCTLNRHN